MITNTTSNAFKTLFQKIKKVVPDRLLSSPKMFGPKIRCKSPSCNKFAMALMDSVELSNTYDMSSSSSSSLSSPSSDYCQSCNEWKMECEALRVSNESFEKENFSLLNEISCLVRDLDETRELAHDIGDLCEEILAEQEMKHKNEIGRLKTLLEQAQDDLRQAENFRIEIAQDFQQHALAAQQAFDSLESQLEMNKRLAEDTLEASNAEWKNTFDDKCRECDGLVNQVRGLEYRKEYDQRILQNLKSQYTALSASLSDEKTKLKNARPDVVLVRTVKKFREENSALKVKMRKPMTTCDTQTESTITDVRSIGTETCTFSTQTGRIEKSRVSRGSRRSHRHRKGGRK